MFSIIDMTILRQFLKFSGVGIFGTAAQYTTLVILVQYAGLYSVAASTVGYIIGAFVNYFLNYHLTFKSSKPHKEAIWKFFSVAAVGLLLNGAIMQLLVSAASMPYIIAQVIATGLVLVWNFSANRMWTFVEKSS